MATYAPKTVTHVTSAIDDIFAELDAQGSAITKLEIAKTVVRLLENGIRDREALKLGVMASNPAVTDFRPTFPSVSSPNLPLTSGP